VFAGTRDVLNDEWEFPICKVVMRNVPYPEMLDIVEAKVMKQ
jgi:hypothetical protein